MIPDGRDWKNFLEEELLEEVEDVGHCGVYGLVWRLRGREKELAEPPEPALTDPERVQLAKEVVLEALNSGRFALRRFEWPSSEPISGFLSFDDISEEDWLDIPESGKYPAFVPPAG
jgi:hypothetical protein